MSTPLFNDYDELCSVDTMDTIFCLGPHVKKHLYFGILIFL
jgi:hypothetical protein